MLLDEKHGDHDIDPGIREYTRVFTLPKPVIRGGARYDVLMMGKAGRIVLLDTHPSTPMEKRLYKPPNGGRPGDCSSSDQSTAVPITTEGGKLFVMGGCTSDDTAMASADVYHVQDDRWTRTPTGIMRGVGASLLLPDGRILLLSGENGHVNQNRYPTFEGATNTAREDIYGPSDPRIAQIFDPRTRTVTTEWTEAADVYRGYHNTAALLPDGRVMVGGGFNQWGDVGCENPNLRLFSPSYLGTGMPRPRLTRLSDQLVDMKGEDEQVVELTLGSSVRFEHDQGVGLHPSRPASLVALQAYTHSYGQNQRHVQVLVRDRPGQGLTLELPQSPLLLAGFYHLFLLSEDGVPSVAARVKVVRDAKDSAQPAGTDTFDWVMGIVVFVVVLIIVVIIVGAIVFFARRRCRSKPGKNQQKATEVPRMTKYTKNAYLKSELHINSTASNE